jgi:hypothetical protein
MDDESEFGVLTVKSIDGNTMFEYRFSEMQLEFPNNKFTAHPSFNFACSDYLGLCSNAKNISIKECISYNVLKSERLNFYSSSRESTKLIASQVQQLENNELFISNEVFLSDEFKILCRLIVICGIRDISSNSMQQFMYKLVRSLNLSVLPHNLKCSFSFDLELSTGIQSKFVFLPLCLHNLQFLLDIKHAIPHQYESISYLDVHSPLIPIVNDDFRSHINILLDSRNITYHHLIDLNSMFTRNLAQYINFQLVKCIFGNSINMYELDSNSWTLSYDIYTGNIDVSALHVLFINFQRNIMKYINKDLSVINDEVPVIFNKLVLSTINITSSDLRLDVFKHNHETGKMKSKNGKLNECIVNKKIDTNNKFNE